MSMFEFELAHHFGPIIYAFLFGPAGFGVVLTCLMAALLFRRGTVRRMVVLGVLITCAGHLVAWAGFALLHTDYGVQSGLAENLGIPWYLFCIFASTVAILGSGVYCWVRPACASIRGWRGKTTKRCSVA